MKKILVVDDNFHNLNLVRLIFELEPYTLLIAENGREALAIAEAERPEVILLDILLPGDLDGYLVCQLLRRNERTKNLHVIMLTAKGQEWDKEAGFAAGADEYVVKPYSPLELKDRVTAILEAPFV